MSILTDVNNNIKLEKGKFNDKEKKFFTTDSIKL